MSFPEATVFNKRPKYFSLALFPASLALHLGYVVNENQSGINLSLSSIPKQALSISLQLRRFLEFHTNVPQSNKEKTCAFLCYILRR